ncbi:hypothetical protein EVAR_98382_1 [Eumeta japonica]|uniref:Uncharacterized protein n=1 Tax=Eumeta variegata TaxID=151549 RepID=A0A4C1XU02_EUMVA|nr:hypothetical protein EVAR_98382_1 [Eumeta japonica]
MHVRSQGFARMSPTTAATGARGDNAGPAHDGQENHNLKRKMGSAKVFSCKPQTRMAESSDKKSIKDILRKPFQAIFQRVDSKRRSKSDGQKARHEEVLREPSIKPILSLLENLTIDNDDGKDAHADKEILENFEYLAIDDGKEKEDDSKPCRDIEFSSRSGETKTETDHRIDAIRSKSGHDATRTVKDKLNAPDTQTTKDKHKTIDDSTKESFEHSKKDNDRKDKKNEECRNERIDSNSSNDSGYSDKADDVVKGPLETVVGRLQELEVGEEGAKSERCKKIQKVYVSRAPVKSKHSNANHHPYQQISQINKQTFSGGQVIVKSPEIPERSEWQNIPHEIDLAISQVDLKVNDFTRNTHEEQVDRWNIAQEFVTENQKDEFLKAELENFVFRTLENDPLLDFTEIAENTNYEIGGIIPPCTQVNPIDEFNEKQYFNNDFETQSVNSLDELLAFNLTPPRSNENSHESPVRVPCSPKNSFYCTPPYTNSVSSGTYNSPNSDYVLSPERSSPNDFQNDYESYQDLPVFDEQNLPSCVDGLPREVTPKEGKKPQRTSSITMRTVKDILKRLNTEFSKSQCCQKTVADSKSFFQEQFQKFSVDERKTLCLKVTSMELDATYE